MLGKKSSRIKKALAEATSRLIARGGSDVTRWADPANLHADWEERAVMAAEFALPARPLLDLGCGIMALERHLAPGIAYCPADIVSRREDCQVVDLNKGEFPAGAYGTIAMLGVLEYLYEPVAVLRKAQGAADRLIASYALNLGAKPEKRRANGWVSDLTEPEMLALLNDAGWNVIVQKPIRVRRKVRHDLFVCDARRL